MAILGVELGNLPLQLRNLSFPGVFFLFNCRTSIFQFLSLYGAQPSHIKRQGNATVCSGELVLPWLTAIRTLLGVLCILRYPSIVAIFAKSVSALWEVEIPRLLEFITDAARHGQSRPRPNLLVYTFKFIFLVEVIGALTHKSIGDFEGYFCHILLVSGHVITSHHSINCRGVCLCLHSGIFQPLLPAAVNYVRWIHSLIPKGDLAFHLFCGEFRVKALRAIGLGRSIKLIFDCVERRIHNGLRPHKLINLGFREQGNESQDLVLEGRQNSGSCLKTEAKSAFVGSVGARLDLENMTVNDKFNVQMSGHVAIGPSLDAF